VAGQGFEPWKASADGFIDRCRATGHRCTLKSPVDHALTGRAVARGLATSTGAVRPGWEGGGIPTTSRWVTTPHQGGRTPPRSESHIGSLDTARSGDDRKLLSQSTEVTSLASGVDHIPSHCRRMPRASTCKAISHATARLRSLIEKHLTRFRCSASGHNNRSESERCIFTYSWRARRVWRGSVWVSFMAGRYRPGAFGESL
jgi:hypothetical protein